MTNRPRNSTRRIETAASLLSSRSFKAGLADRVTGRPFNVDDWPLADHWPYERGRLFAAGLLATGKRIPVLPTRGQPLRRYGDAFRALDRLLSEGVVI